MSDDEYYEEETRSNTSKKGDEAFAKAKAGVKKVIFEPLGGGVVFYRHGSEKKF